MKKIIMYMFTLFITLTAYSQEPDKTKWTVVLSESLYGGVASDIAPITLQSFSFVDSIWLESIIAFRFFDISKQPLFTGLGAHFRLKATDTGFGGGITLGAGWSQQTEKIKLYIAFSVRF